MKQLSYTIPSPRYILALQKLVAGVFIYFLHTFSTRSDDSLLDYGASILSSSLIISAASDLLNAGLIFLSKKRVSRQHNQDYRQRQMTNKQVQVYYQNLRLQQIISRGCYSICNLLMLNRYHQRLLNLIDKNISIIALQFPEELQANRAGPILSYLHMPLIVPTTLILAALGSVYNIKELIYLLKDEKPRPEDSAFFGFVNSISLVSTTAQLFQYFQANRSTIAGEIDMPKGLSSGDRAAYIMQQIMDLKEQAAISPIYLHYLSWINHAARYKTYTSFSTLIQQGINESTKQFTIEVANRRAEVLSAEPHVAQVKSVKKRVKTTPPVSASLAELSPVTHHATSSQHSLSDQTPGEDRVKVKEKTHGTSTPRPVTAPQQLAIHQTSNLHYKKTSPIRAEKLALFKKLRRVQQVKSWIIESELTQLINHLPDAKCKGTTGSEFRLTWHWKDKDYALKFEKIHGSNNDYSGRKLKKILNVLEVAYLWGWDKQHIDQHLASQQGGRYFGRLFNVLFERPEVYAGVSSLGAR